MDEPDLKTLIAHLDSLRAPLDHWLSFWTWVVIGGVAFELITVIREYVDDRRIWWRAATRGVIFPPERPLKCWALFDLLAIAVVVAGIAGELVVEARIAKNETSLRDANGSLMLLLDQKAGDAATSARNASLAAGDAQTKAGNADTVAGEAQQKASSALSLARDAGTEADAVATETKELSFRSTVLLDAEDEIVKAVSPFREQKDLIESCGQAQQPDRWNNDRESSEKWETRYVLAHLVEAEGSWRRLSKRQNWGGCDRPWVGIFVFVNTDAPRKTIQAAEALSTVLTSVLPPRRPEVLQLVNPADTGHVDDPDHPFAMVEDRPDLIVVLIGAQPVPDITRKPQSNEPKTGPKPLHLLPPSP